MNQEYLNKIRDIQDHLIELIENQFANDNDINIFTGFLQDQKISKNQHELKDFLHLILKISNHHYHPPDFYDKIEKILIFMKKEILKYFTNNQIFNIFHNNKRILLFLFEEKFIEPNRTIALTITDEKYRNLRYPEYFYPEFKTIFNELIEKDRIKYKQIEEITKEINKKYPKIDNEKRKVGENDDFICQIIRKDSANEFIDYINRNNCLVTANINSSIYETHPYLINKDLTLIEYSAFFGAVQIMKYLYHQSIILSPSLWIFAIHGSNPALIHLLEENKIKPSIEVYQQCFLEAVKCHHNDLANYIESNFLLPQNPINESTIFLQAINYHNFTYFSDDATIDFDVFYALCENDYYLFVEDFLKESSLNLNLKKIIFKFFFS